MTARLAPRLSTLAAPWRIAVTLAIGGIGGLSLAPFHISPAILLMLVAGFDFLAAAQTGRRAFATGWWLGVGYFAVTLHWITSPFQVDAAAHAWMAPFALAGMAGGLALFWGAGFWLARHLAPGGWALVITWPLAELARAYLFTGFPWATPPQALVDLWLGQGLAWLGPHGMMLALCGLAAALALPRYKLLPFLGALLISVALFLFRFSAPAPEMTQASLRLIQPNAPQHEKWDPDKIPVFLDRQRGYAAAPGTPDWIILPETALPYLIDGTEADFGSLARAAVAPVITGIQRREDWSYFNSLITLDGSGQVAQYYDKHHLVPFGEYMPFPALFRNLGIRGLAERTEAAYTPGPGPRLLQLEGIGSVLPLICYEAVFAHDVAAAPSRPNLLLHITNDAWFGTFAGPQQHLSQARMRAIEQGLPVARSANTGISAMIGPRGQVLDALPLNVADYIDVRLPAPLSPTLYARTGDLPWILLLSGLTLGVFLHGWRKRLTNGN